MKRGNDLGQVVSRNRFTCCDSRFKEKDAHVAQLVEHVLGKDEVSGSIPLVGSSFYYLRGACRVEGEV